MLSGYSIRSKLVGTGNRQIVSIHMQGEVVDLQNSMLQTAEALATSTAATCI